jgi:hypothetical protein
MRAKLGDMGITAIADDEGEIECRLKRIETIRGIDKDTENEQQETKEDILDAATRVVLVATIEQRGKDTLDTVNFTNERGCKIKRKRTSMLSTWLLKPAAETLGRGFGKDVTLTLVEFENDEMAQNALPEGTGSRAVPILDKNREVKSIEDLVKELARLMGECAYCDNKRLRCNKVNKSGGCRFVNRQKGAIQAVIASVDEQMVVGTAPLAILRSGKIVLAPKIELLDNDVAKAVYTMSQDRSEKEEAKEDGEITEEPTTETREEPDDLFGDDSSSVLAACNLYEAKGH